MQNGDNHSIVDNIVFQFLCTVPLKEFYWGSSARFSIQEQEAVLNRTVRSELNQNHPVHLKYQRVFLKAFLDLLEKQINCEKEKSEEYSEIFEELYTVYTELLGSNKFENRDFFKHYVLKCSGTIISLKEDINLISEGTTGLRTWQAAFTLAEWCIENKESLKAKKVLELGSGIGLTGITLALECSPDSVHMTDCHHLVLEKLISNVEHNCGSITVSNSEHPYNRTEAYLARFKGTKIAVVNLPWEEVGQKVCQEKLQTNFDVILAADIVYDSELFPPLVQALKSLCKYCQVKEIIFACTERNEKTLEDFIKVMSDSFSMEKLKCPAINNFFAWDNSTVHLIKFVFRD